MVAGAVVLSLATIHLDRATVEENWVATLGWTFTRGPEGSRAVLSTVAGSMMTITSVAFSITVVALQLASSQFGPRLLRNFMRDRVNQAALGTFIATFTYCLLVLRTVNGTEDERVRPARLGDDRAAAGAGEPGDADLLLPPRGGVDPGRQRDRRGQPRAAPGHRTPLPRVPRARRPRAGHGGRPGVACRRISTPNRARSCRRAAATSRRSTSRA